uniref:Uncharacterized protein n=1 Tax=Arundo donax TaxID=35708 RepID=A0A0A9GP45_ARUDO
MVFDDDHKGSEGISILVERRGSILSSAEL